MANEGAVLVTGASGFLGRLVAAGLLANEGVEVVLPIRDKHTAEGIAAAMVEELRALGAGPHLMERAHIVSLPPNAELDRLLPAFREHGIREIAHCAGCLSYYNVAKLKEGNVELTRGLLELGRRAGIRRFFYLSTAFASGLVEDTVRESLHEGVRDDPTEYMRSKRETEWLVASSGLPYVIIRPAIIIGDSRDGRYIGKPYGLYQLWNAAEKFASQRYMPVIHAIAPRIPLQVVHQNAFQQSFLALRRQPANGVIAHIAGREQTLPTVRDLWDLWLLNWARPQEIYYYDRLDDVPVDDLDQDERLLVEFAAANIEISTHHWRFESRVLDGLRAGGLEFDDATVASVERCQRSFMAQSDRIQQFLAEHADKLHHDPKIVENYAATSLA